MLVFWQSSSLLEVFVMRIQLRLFLGRFNQAIAAYSLARLEAMMRNPGVPEAPVLQRLGSVGARDKEVDNWLQTRRQIEALQRYVSSLKKGKIRLCDDAARERLIQRARRVVELKNSIEALHVSHGRGRAH